VDKISEWINRIVLKEKPKHSFSVDKIRSLFHFDFSDSLVISVTGTNGKGTVVKLLEACFLAADYRVACFTSPHLHTPNERVRLNGQNIETQKLLNLLNKIEAMPESKTFGFFHYLAIAAFFYFQEAQPEVVILEVGIGGEKDIVNVIDADIAVISSIGLDHCEILGDTLERIGQQKAGLFRGNKIAIVSAQTPIDSIDAHAKKLGARLLKINRDFSMNEKCTKWQYENRVIEELSFSRSLHPDNVAAVLTVLAESTKLPVSTSTIRSVLENFVMPGRCTVLKDHGVTAIVDVAHNPQAVEYLASFVRSRKIIGPLVAVASFKPTKDVLNILNLMKPLIDKWYIFSHNSPWLLTRAALHEKLKSAGIQRIFCCDDLPKAYQSAKMLVGNNGAVIVFGSFIVAGEILGSVKE